MKQIFTIILSLSLMTGMAQMKSQLPKSLDEKQWEGYQACTECLEQWKSNATGQNTKQSVNQTGSKVAGQVVSSAKSRGKVFIGIISTVIGGAAIAYVVNKSSTLSNALTTH